MPLAEYIEGPIQGQRTATQLLALLAVVAALLAAIGLYGLIAFTVEQRTGKSAFASRSVHNVGTSFVRLRPAGLRFSSSACRLAWAPRSH